MSVIQKVSSGLVYRDQFQSGFLDPLWNVIPTDPSRYSLTDQPNTLRIKPEGTPTYAFLSVLSDMDSFVFEVRGNYYPLTDSDRAGIIIYSTDSDYLPLEQYHADPPVVYPFFRLIRSFNEYQGYASFDGNVWNMVGSQSYWNNNPQIGIFIASAVDTATPTTPLDAQNFDITDVSVYKNRYVRVGNMVSGMKVELVNSFGERIVWGAVHGNDTYADIDVSSLTIPFNAGVKIYGNDGGVMESNVSNPLTFWGGDEYKFSISPDVYYLEDFSLGSVSSTPLPVTPLPQEDRIEEESETFLGYINGGSQPVAYRRFIVKNNETGSFSNLIVSLQEYNSTNDYLTMADIALDDGTGYPSTFGKNITIPKLDIGEEVIVWVRIMRDTTGIPKDHAYFQVQVQAIFSY